MASLIPLRPKSGKYDLRQEEMDGLSWYVLSGCTREDAFLKFIRPDFIGSKASSAIKSAVQQFFAMKDVKDYIESYKATIASTLKGEEKPKDIIKDIETRKAEAKVKAEEFIIEMANDLEHASDPEFVLKAMDKVGFFDDEKKQEEVPRRYLPEDCDGCRYRLFCEEQCEDECVYCKYKKFGEENGLHLKPENQLEIPGTKVDEE